MDISIIIPNYNGKELMEKNLSSVVSSLRYYIDKMKVKGEIILVDDASTDGSIVSIKNYVSSIKSKVPFKILENEKNLGFSSTINRGVKEATGEIIVLLNTDVTPEEGFLIPLIAHFENENVFAVGCTDKSIEAEKTVIRGRGIGKWERGFLSHSRGEVDRDNTLWVSGGSGAFRKTYWNILGGFYPIYNPFYWEDIDLSYRAMKAGYQIIFERKSIVVHNHEQGSIQTHYSQEKIKEIAYRNQFYFVWLNITDTEFLVGHVLWTIIHIFVAIKNNNRAFIGGFFKAFKNLPYVLQLRKKNLNFFIQSDKKILAEFIR